MSEPPQSNTEEWVSVHKEDHGGFVYFPGKSMAVKEQTKMELFPYDLTEV